MRVEIIASACCALPLQIKPGSFTGFTHDALVLCLSASHLSASESSILEAVIHWGREQLASAGGHLSVRLQQPGTLDLSLAHSTSRLAVRRSMGLPEVVLSRWANGIDAARLSLARHHTQMTWTTWPWQPP